MLEHSLWCEKYRPKTIEETILTPDMKKTFQQFVDEGDVPNLILTGTQGVGKTTVAKAMLEQLGCDYIIINGSMNGNIDTLRNEILNFASSVSLSGGRKYVILDEADYLNQNSTQPALRNFMEEFSKNCGFILTCNYIKRIIEPLWSRTSIIDFNVTKKEMPKLAMQFMKRVEIILATENVPYERPVLAEVIQKHFPDCRRIINELQTYSKRGKIDSGILSKLNQVSLKELVGFLKDKNFTEIRKWVGENLDNDQNTIFRTLYDTCYDFLTKQSVPQLVLILGKYQYQAAFACDQEINMMACLTELMIELEFTK